MKVSVSSYSFHQYIKAGKMTAFECVSKAKEMGFDGIEFTDLPGETLEEQKKLAAEIAAEAERVGIEINAYTIRGDLYHDTKEGSDAEVARLCDQLDVAKILGAAVLRHDVCYKLGTTGKSRSFDLMLPTIAENARRVTEYGQSIGIRTCSENHGYISQDSDRVERLFNAVAHDNFGLLVDMGNFICVDENPITAVSRVAPYAVHVHIKDMMVRNTPVGRCNHMTRGGNYFCGTVVGEGDIPVLQCLRIMKRAGYDGYVSLEYEGAEDCIDGIARGFANVKAFLEQI